LYCVSFVLVYLLLFYVGFSQISIHFQQPNSFAVTYSTAKFLKAILTNLELLIFLFINIYYRLQIKLLMN